MPLATNQTWLKSYGNLPWWRSGASSSGKQYPKALGPSSVRRYAKPKNRVSCLKMDKGQIGFGIYWRLYAQCAVLSGVEFVDGNPGHGPCSRCRYEEQTREGVCFGCFLMFGGPMKPWEAKMLNEWKRENPGWTGQRLATGRIAQNSQDAQVAFSREPTVYEKRVDFAAIVTGLDHLEAQGLTRIRALLAAARDRLLSLVGRKLGENRLTTKFVNDLELRGLGQLVPTLREIMRAAFRQGEQGARDELKQAQGTSGKPKALSRNDPEWGIKAIMLAAMAEHPDWTGAQIVAEVKKQQDIRQYQVRHTLEGLPPEKALEFFEQKAFLWGADIRDPLLSDIKNILFDAIKMGRPLRDIQAQLGSAFLPWLGDPNQLIDEEMLTPYRLETLVRTNVNEALNEGRKAMFQPEVDSGFITAFQFSAILDKRTTEVCKYLDRKMFRPDSPELDRLSPPRHFSCRSLWTMVTRADGPVQFIRADEVAKGVLLSGKGFCDGHEAHGYQGEDDHA